MLKNLPYDTLLHIQSYIPEPVDPGVIASYLESILYLERNAVEGLLTRAKQREYTRLLYDIRPFTGIVSSMLLEVAHGVEMERLLLRTLPARLRPHLEDFMVVLGRHEPGEEVCEDRSVQNPTCRACRLSHPPFLPFVLLSKIITEVTVYTFPWALQEMLMRLLTDLRLLSQLEWGIMSHVKIDLKRFAQYLLRNYLDSRRSLSLIRSCRGKSDEPEEQKDIHDCHLDRRGYELPSYRVSIGEKVRDFVAVMDTYYETTPSLVGRKRPRED